MPSRLLIATFALSLLVNCTWWTPHSLVASNKPIREAVFTAKRVEAESCQHWIFGIPYGDTLDSIDDLMELLHDQAAQSVALQDIRVDQITRWYVVYWESCVHGSAEPVLRIPIVPPKGSGGGPSAPSSGSSGGQPPPGPAPSTSPQTPGGGEKTPEELEKELLGP